MHRLYVVFTVVSYMHSYHLPRSRRSEDFLFVKFSDALSQPTGSAGVVLVRDCVYRCRHFHPYLATYCSS